jgi:Zn-dependent protease
MMNGSFRLGRVAGIPISANWSVLVIAALLTYSLAVGILPAAGVAGAAAWLLAIAGAVIFLSSLLAHELGHSIVALRAGVKVEEITLWLFGGVAKLANEARNGRDELRIAAAGPAVSVALAVSFAALAVPLQGGLAALLWWLAIVNAALAIFNLLPGLPLDGGRILRAWLWSRHGDQLRATRTASAAGRMVGAGLIGLGVMSFLTGGPGLWTALIGFFIYSAARQELVVTETMHALRHVTVGQLTDPNPLVVPERMTVAELVERLLVEPFRGDAVLHDDHGRIVGVVPLDAVAQCPPDRRAWTTLAEIGIPAAGETGVALAHPAWPVSDALEQTQGRRSQHLLVFDGPRFVGLVSPATIERATALAGR